MMTPSSKNPLNAYETLKTLEAPKRPQKFWRPLLRGLGLLGYHVLRPPGGIREGKGDMGRGIFFGGGIRV